MALEAMPLARPSASEQRAAFLASREARQILPGLWQGPEEFPAALLESAGVTHVLSVVEDAHAPRAAAAAPRGHLHIRIADLPSEDLASQLPRAIDFIHEARLAGGVVLVHCYHGVSRSGAVVLAYLTAHLGCTVFQAWHYVLALCGKYAAPNYGFERQLLHFEREGAASGVGVGLRKKEAAAGVDLRSADAEFIGGLERAAAAGGTGQPQLEAALRA